MNTTAHPGASLRQPTAEHSTIGVARAPIPVARPRPRRGFRWGPLLAVLVLLAAAVVAGILAMRYVDRPASSAPDTSSVRASRPPVNSVPLRPTPSATPSAPAPSPPAAVPVKPPAAPVDQAPPKAAAGSRKVANANLGYRLTIPAEWNEVCLADNQTCRYNSLSGEGRLAVPDAAAVNSLFAFVHDAKGKDAATLAQEEDADRAADTGGFPNYSRVRLEEATAGPHAGSLLEYTYDSSTAGARHVVIFRTVANGTSYELSLNGPEKTFASDLPTFRRATETLEIL
jgi:hypothetical protein